MKKLIIVVIAMVICVMLTTSIADEFEFSFRNNIHFGDDPDTVIQKEKEMNEDVSPYTYDHRTVVEINNLVLSNIENSDIFYRFEQEKLVSIAINYCLNSTQNGKLEAMKNDYKSINDGLTRKYGNSVSEKEDEITGLYRGAIFDYQNQTGNKELFSIAQWVVEYDSELNLIIDHVLYSYENSYGTKNAHSLSYQLVKKGTTLESQIDKDL